MDRKNFKLRAIYWIIRHPCATISSYINAFINSSTITEEWLKNSKYNIIKDILNIPELRHNNKLIEKLKTIKSLEEILAAIWSIDTYIPLCYQRYNWWYTIIYERLVINGEEELKGIFRYIGEEIPEEAYKRLSTPSITVRDKIYAKSKIQIEKWKKRLSRRQIENILKVTRWFGLDFYTDKPEPCYKELKGWR